MTSTMTRRLILLLAVIAALPLAAQDVLSIGTVSGTPGSTVTVPVYLRDVTGTALGDGSGAGNRIQGIMLQVAATPAVVGLTITFDRTGSAIPGTALYERSGNGGWLASFSESAQPLPLRAGVTERIGTLRVTLPSALTGTGFIALTLQPSTTMLSNQAGTVTESQANRHLQLISGAVILTAGTSTTTALTSTPNPSSAGNSVTFTATITSATTPIGGSVIFTEAGQMLGSAIVQQGTATWTTTALTQGTHTIRAEYEGDATHARSVSSSVQQVVKAALPAPANVVATAVSTTQVAVAWSPSAGATQYEVRRKAPGGDYALVGTVPSTNFNDLTALPGQTYLYVVRAIGSETSSVDSARDAATTVLFTDNPNVSGTRIKRVHLDELRTAVNAFRAAAGLAAATFTEPSPLVAKKVHLEELRAKLAEARAALAMPALTLTDVPPLRIKGVQVQELRTAVQ